jgi:succinate dehydrogenase/fumarate reductase flavoprotein subunit
MRSMAGPLPASTIFMARRFVVMRRSAALGGLGNQPLIRAPMPVTGIKSHGAAVAAARNGARVLLLDKNVIGRGGATIMAQMTCASALGEVEPDSPQLHLEDTLGAGRGLCNENLAALLCEGSPKRIRELAGWKVNWARRDDGRISQVKAPGRHWRTGEPRQLELI